MLLAQAILLKANMFLEAGVRNGGLSLAVGQYVSLKDFG